MSEVKSKDANRGRPGGLNTVEMLKHASSKLGMGPHHAMKIAERLYLSGYMTYPRTETTSYPENFDHRSTVKAISLNYTQSIDLMAFARDLLKDGINTPKKGIDVGDHPPITPSTQVPSGLFGDEYRLYDFVARRYLASIGYDAVVTKSKVTFKFNDQYSTTVDGMILKDKGYLEAANWEIVEHKQLGVYKVGDSFQITDTMIVEGETEPPGFLSESELITLMEKHNIGTDASMASHINNICEREYVKIVGSRKLEPTNLGIALVNGYQAVDNSLVSPDLRSMIEKSCADIASGESKFEDVVIRLTAVFKNKFLEFKKNVTKMDAFFKNVFTTFDVAKDQSKSWTTCGKCKRYMDMVKDYNKVVCETCSKTYNLPRSPNYIKSGNIFCPVDGFQMFQYVQSGKL